MPPLPWIIQTRNKILICRHLDYHRKQAKCQEIDKIHLGTKY
jgi:hypothetical protein